jgi:SOS-response transcriptional repressor LexA
MDIGNKIRIIREIKGITRNQLCKATGYTPTYISRIERGLHPKLPLDTLEKIAKALGMEISEVISWEPPKLESKAEKPESTEGVAWVPVLKEIPSNLSKAKLNEFAESFEPVPERFPDSSKLFALSVLGDSMAPVIKNGDIIMVSPEATWASGDVVVARTEEGGTVINRMRIREDSIVLEPFNPLFPQIFFKIGQITIIGKVVRVITHP